MFLVVVLFLFMISSSTFQAREKPMADMKESKEQLLREGEKENVPFGAFS